MASYTYSIDACSSTGGAPLCWDWGITEINNYIRAHEGIARQTYVSRHTNGTPFDNVLHNILLNCLTTVNTYAFDTRSMLPIILEAAFHRHNALPFSDVFSALGWFISYAEPPVADLERTQFRLLCYTRLCYNLGKEIGKIKPKKAKKPYFPTVTHVFIEGNWTALTTEENRSTLHLTMSLSSSLPVSTAGKKYPDAKIILRQKRLEALGNIRNSPWMQQAPTMREVTQGMYQTNQGMAGNCAETLNLASHRSNSSSRQTIGFGQALAVHKLPKQFLSPQDCLKASHTDPCDSCDYFLGHSGVSQQDMGTGWTYGNLPAGYAEDDNWPVRQSSSNRPDWGYNEYSEARSSQEGTLPMLAGRPVNGSPDYWRNVGQGHAFVVLRR